MPSLKLTVRDWTSAEAQNKLVSQPPFFRFHVSLCKKWRPTSETKWNQILDRQCLFEGSYGCGTSRWSCMQPAEQELSKRTLLPAIPVWSSLDFGGLIAPALISFIGNQTIPAASWRILQSSVVFPIYKTRNASKQTSYSPREINSFNEQEQELPIAFCLYIISHSIHVWYIFIHIYHKINSSCR